MEFEHTIVVLRAVYFPNIVLRWYTGVLEEYSAIPLHQKWAYLDPV